MYLVIIMIIRAIIIECAVAVYTRNMPIYQVSIMTRCISLLSIGDVNGAAVVWSPSFDRRE